WILPGDAPAKIWPYEPGFIKAFRDQAFKPVQEMSLSEPFDQLVKQVVGSLEGFSLGRTRNYYKNVVSRACKQVKSEADYEARFKQADRDINWLMLDDDWSGGMRGLEGGGYHYRPWWYYGRPYGSYSWSRGSMGGPIGGGAATPELSAPTTSFGDVANSLTGRLETFSNNLAGSMDSLSEGARGIDLSSVDKFTSEMLSDMASGSGGGGGGFGGGCACAGCACACACAGGGR
ncbi:MAG: hypothetical protein ACYTGB_16805, partial [Planctomycetota bacterium]